MGMMGLVNLELLHVKEKNPKCLTYHGLVPTPRLALPVWPEVHAIESCGLALQKRLPLSVVCGNVLASLWDLTEILNERTAAQHGVSELDRCGSEQADRAAQQMLAGIDCKQETWRSFRLLACAFRNYLGAIGLWKSCRLGCGCIKRKRLLRTWSGLFLFEGSASLSVFAAPSVEKELRTSLVGRGGPTSGNAAAFPRRQC
eukprot:51786-Amphidinium_carterae.1